MKTGDDDGDGGTTVGMMMMPRKDDDGRQIESPNRPWRLVMNEDDQWEVGDFERRGVGERRRAVCERQ